MKELTGTNTVLARVRQQWLTCQDIDAFTTVLLSFASEVASHCLQRRPSTDIRKFHQHE